MELTKQEIVSVADRLDDVIGNAFHDAIISVLSERKYLNLDDMEVGDLDIYRIKNELKLHL
tara:strand:+ start:168 stop:350 length:183 start_codon:yes stop_codon:yes gene_type:complete